MTTVAVCLLLTGCGVGEGTGSTPPWADPETETVDEPTAAVDDDEEPIEPYRVRLETTKGDVIISVHPDWARRGARRFRELVESGFYDDSRIFRVIPEFVVQLGISNDRAANEEWDQKPIIDDQTKESNTRGRVTFATSGEDSRTTQIFINLADNSALDTRTENFAPFGEVVEGMEVVDAFNSQYGEEPTGLQGEISAQGNAFLDEKFPGLDSIIRATVVEEPSEKADGAESADAADSQ